MTEPVLYPTRRRTLLQMGMSRAAGYYLRSGRVAATIDPETTNKNELITDLGIGLLWQSTALELWRWSGFASSLFVPRFACAPQVNGPGRKKACV
jgi:hypothetical protein